MDISATSVRFDADTMWNYGDAISIVEIWPSASLIPSLPAYARFWHPPGVIPCAPQHNVMRRRHGISSGSSAPFRACRESCSVGGPVSAQRHFMPRRARDDTGIRDYGDAISIASMPSTHLLLSRLARGRAPRHEGMGGWPQSAPLSLTPDPTEIPRFFGNRPCFVRMALSPHARASQDATATIFSNYWQPVVFHASI
jgi:hypothetical protein